MTNGAAGTGHVVAVPVTTVWASADAPDASHTLLVADRPDVASWCAVDDPDSRLGLHGRSLTQALLGEPVIVDEEQDGWARVRLPWQPAATAGGYPGWVPRHHLCVVGVGSAELSAVVVAATTTLRQGDGSGLEVSIGTVLPVERAPETAASDVLVRTPSGGLAALSAADVLVRGTAAAPARTAATDALRLARSLLDTRYFWGGTSRWAVDCSGLVHLTLRAAGVTVPRDARDQFATLDRVDLDSVRPGDLYFFADSPGPVTHVGFVADAPAAGRRPMLHAPEVGGRGRAEETVMSGELLSRLVGAGRIRSREDG